MQEKLRIQSGATAVEFAIILPILLLLILGIIEFGFLLFNRAVITNATREGARAGIIQRDPSIGRVSPAEIETAVNNYCFNHLITFGGTTTPTVVSKISNDAGAIISDPPCPTGAYSGLNLKVTSTFDYHYLALPSFVSGLIGGTTLTAQAVMKCE